ncbi:MAG: hypothetical protein KAX49_03730 [Halanaerobiales bacterium]|nr:hypothetical protein [Halanaerobiales bacterium]
MKIKYPDDIINTIINGDSLEIIQNIPDDSIDFIFTDPPYNVGKVYDKYGDNLNNTEYLNWSLKWFSECNRISKCIVFTPGIYNLKMWINIKEPLWILAWILKNGMSRNRLRGFINWEPVLVYGKIKKRIFQDIYYAPLTNQKNIGTHPSPKPLRLFYDLIKDFTEEGDIVLDPFVGAGTSVVAAKSLKREFIGIDISKTYCETTEKRLRNTKLSKSITNWIES